VLSLPQVQDVCLYGHGHIQCRYLDRFPDNTKHFCCLKLTPDRQILDRLVDEHLEQCSQSRHDPSQSTVAIGDNCPGYHRFGNLPQGYDVE